MGCPGISTGLAVTWLSAGPPRPGIDPDGDPDQGGSYTSHGYETLVSGAAIVAGALQAWKNSPAHDAFRIAPEAPETPGRFKPES